MTMFLPDEKAASTLEQTWEFCLDSFAIGRFGQLTVERGLEHVGSASWSTEQGSFEGVEHRIVATQRSRGWRSAVFELGDVAEGCIALVALGRGAINVRVAGRTPVDLDAARVWLRELYPVTEQSEEQRIWITFWSLGQHGARQNMRQIDVPTWPEVGRQLPGGRRRQARRGDGGGVRTRRRRPAAPLARASGHRQDLRAARARVGVALLV